MSSVILKVQDLRTHFFMGQEVLRAVDGISYDVHEGETTILLGESGCGKTMSVLSILRMVPAPGKVVDGKIIFGGQNLLEASEEEMINIRGQGISMVFQEPMTSLNPIIPIGEQIAEPLKEHLKMSSKSARKRAIELMHLVGLPDPERRHREYPFQFSAGMRQRVMIAMALSCNPKILIADEPTTALDVTIQAQILDLITGLAKQTGTAVILITHNLGLVARYADTVNVMYAGRIIESGLADAVCDKPMHPYLQGLLQCIPRIENLDDQQLNPIYGRPPDLSQKINGCYFQPRCPISFTSCSKQYPSLDLVGDGHYCACFARR